MGHTQCCPGGEADFCFRADPSHRLVEAVVEDFYFSQRRKHSIQEFKYCRLSPEGILGSSRSERRMQNHIVIVRDS